MPVLLTCKLLMQDSLLGTKGAKPVTKSVKGFKRKGGNRILSVLLKTLVIMEAG